jgi:hypothetical protein
MSQTDKLVKTIPSFNESFGVIVVIDFGIFFYVFDIVAFELYFGFLLVFVSTPASFDLNFTLNVFGNILTFVPLLWDLQAKMFRKR